MTNLERLEELGQKKLVDDIRHSLPNRAKILLAEAISKNERDRQDFILREKYSHSKFAILETALQAALDQMKRK